MRSLQKFSSTKICSNDFPQFGEDFPGWALDIISYNFVLSIYTWILLRKNNSLYRNVSKWIWIRTYLTQKARNKPPSFPLTNFSELDKWHYRIHISIDLKNIWFAENLQYVTMAAQRNRVGSFVVDRVWDTLIMK